MIFPSILEERQGVLDSFEISDFHSHTRKHTNSKRSQTHKFCWIQSNCNSIQSQLTEEIKSSPKMDIRGSIILERNSQNMASFKTNYLISTLSEFLKSFGARFVLSSIIIIRTKWTLFTVFFSRFHLRLRSLSLLHYFQMAKFGIYNYFSVIAVCHYLCVFFFSSFSLPIDMLAS